MKKEVVVLSSRPAQNVKLGTGVSRSSSDAKKASAERNGEKSVLHVPSCCFAY